MESKTYLKNFSRLFLIAGLFFWAGCFETRFDFKTIVHHDGSLSRSTSIEGRGAGLFKVPEGSGWQSKSWESKNDGVLLVPDVMVHVLADGKFRPHQEIPSDYQFDLSRQMKGWGDKERARLEAVGIKTPYEEHLFSKNKIRVDQIKGFLALTTVYEETFENQGVIPVLLQDLKEEVKKESQAKGEALQDSEIEVLARLRLENEILPGIRFRSQIRLPGRVAVSNGKKVGRHGVAWEFSMKDFQNDYTSYKLSAVSRSWRLRAIAFFGACGIFMGWVVLSMLLGMRRRKSHARRVPGTKNRPSKKEE